MPVPNSDIARSLDRLADLLELEGGNPFRIRAYRNASRVVGELPRSVPEMLAAGADLSELPGIGKDLAGKIATLAQTGHIAVLDDLERKTPPGLLVLLTMPGLGPKRVRALHDGLGVDSLAELVAAAKQGRIRALPGFGPKTEQRIMQEAEKRAGVSPRIMRSVAEDVAVPLLRYLAAASGVRQVTIAGSYRRCRETVGDLDIVVAATSGSAITDRLVAYDYVASVLAHGTTRASVVLKNEMQVDLRVVPAASYGAALLYFTGSKAHNIALRAIAIDHGLKLNEYGLFEGDRRRAARTETGIYSELGLAFVPPELREDHGEIEAARKGTLPDLITQEDIRGDLHVHTTASDGRDTLADMAEAARERGYAYIAITDHSSRLTVAHGLDANRLSRQIEEIARLNQTLSGLAVLAGIEVDILEDGRLDMQDDVLRRLDLVVAAIHSGFDLPRERQTARLLKAMDNPLVSIVAHPTGRLIGRRDALDLDFERVLAGAHERGVALEINGQPSRLDLDEWHAKLARDMGVRLSLATDAHATAELGFMRYAVEQARRGWVEAADAINTHPLASLRAALRR